MNTYPAVRDPGSIELLFRNMRTTDAPEKITTDYLASVGFRRQSDVKLLELLFFLGFIDSNLSPSAQWKALRGVTDDQFTAILSPAIASSYSKVLQNLPKGKQLDGKALMPFFREETGVSDTEAAYMVLTMQVLSDLAGYQRSIVPDRAEQSTKPPVPAPADDELEPAMIDTLPDVPDEPAPGIGSLTGKVSLNITIPAEAMDAELTDLIKKLLRKAL